MEGSNTERMDQLNDNKMGRLPTGNWHQAEEKRTEYMCGDGVSALFTEKDVIDIGQHEGYWRIGGLIGQQ